METAGPLQVDKGGVAANATKAAGGGEVGPAMPLGHTSREIKVEWGEGAISGAIVLTVEVGPTGVPLGKSGFKLLESTSSTKLNGFARRLETTLMSGEFDAEVFEGFKLAFETNLGTVGVEGDELGVDLLTCSIKVVGTRQS